MPRALRIALGVALLCAAWLAQATEIPALTYHDIVEGRSGDPYAVTVEQFERQMAYLRRAGYQPISLRALDAVREGKASLPRKPVLLTFDDGYKGYYGYAYPILKKYGFPSIVSVVTSWVDRRSAPDYTAAEIMTWDELREIARSPLVEVLSHTDDLHFNAPNNPFGARMPAAVARLHDMARGTYESDEAHRQRVTADLARSVVRIQAELGVAPAGIAWPYGKYEQVLIDAAAALGMRYHLTLDDAPTRIADLPRVNRSTFYDYRSLADLGDALAFRDYRKQQLRFVEIDLAPLAGLSVAERAERIAGLARRMELLRVGAVLLRPFTADGGRAYFHNSAVPLAADVLSHVGYELENGAGLQHLYLSVPAGANRAALRDLARLNWFTGVAFEGAVEPAWFGRVVELFRHYKPALEIGMRAQQADARLRLDFVLVDLPVAAPLAPIAYAMLSTTPRPFFLFDRIPQSGVALVKTAMGALRASGAAHYGYGPDDYLHDQPPARVIVRSLTEHTMVRNTR